MGRGIGRIHQEECLDGRIFQFDQFIFPDLPVVFFSAGDVNGYQSVIIYGRNLQIRGENRRADRNPVTRFQNPVMAERLKYITIAAVPPSVGKICVSAARSVP